MAIGLILFSLLLIMGRNRLHLVVLFASLAFMGAVYLTGAVIIAKLGAPDSGDKTTSAIPVQSYQR